MNLEPLELNAWVKIKDKETTDDIRCFLIENESIELMFNDRDNTVWFTNLRIISFKIDEFSVFDKKYKQYTCTPYSKIDYFDIKKPKEGEDLCIFEMFSSKGRSIKINFRLESNIDKIAQYISKKTL